MVLGDLARVPGLAQSEGGPRDGHGISAEGSRERGQRSPRALRSELLRLPIALSLREIAPGALHAPGTRRGRGPRMQRGNRALVAAGVAAIGVVLASALPARALYLDQGRVWKFSGNFYTQSRLRMQESDPPEDLEGGGTNPNAEIGQLIQWRNYAFPVFEGD